MRFKTILAGVSGGSASNGALELACRFAERFGAHLEAFHARLDPRDLLTYAGDGFGAMSGEFIDRFVEDVDATAKETKASFEAAIARHQILQSLAPSQQSPVKIGASAAWHDETGYAPALVSQRARFFDLIVLGRSERVVDQPHTDVIEQTLINSGRPVLLAPSTPPTNVGEAVAVGWNGSAEATRALAVSLPFLIGARIVSLITVGDKHQESAAALIEYLAWHGIKGQHRRAINPRHRAWSAIAIRRPRGRRGPAGDGGIRSRAVARIPFRWSDARGGRSQLAAPLADALSGDAPHYPPLL